MLSAFAVDALWRSCRSKLSTLLKADVRREKKERGGGGGHFESTPFNRKRFPEEEEDVLDDDFDDSDDEDDEDDEDDALTLYLRYLSILDDLNLCERSCVHPQKHRLIDRAMASVAFRASTLREKEDSYHEEANSHRTTTTTHLFDSETIDERSRHRNESKEKGEMVVPNKFWRERRGFLEREVKRVVDAASKKASSSRKDDDVNDDEEGVVLDDDGKWASSSLEKKSEDSCCDDATGTTTEENASSSSSDDDDDDHKSGDKENESCFDETKEDFEEKMNALKPAKEEDDELESKEDKVTTRKRETMTTKTDDDTDVEEEQQNRLAAIVTIQRHARGCLERKKTKDAAEKELERLGMVLVTKKKKKKRTKTKTMCIDDSRCRSTTSAESDGDFVNDFDDEDSIETKIEAMREERLREFRHEQLRIYDRMKREAFECAHSKKSLGFESFVREYRETHDGALPGSKDIFEQHEEDVLQLPYRATKKNDFDDNENDDDVKNDDEQKCGFEALRKILEASERAFPTTTTIPSNNSHHATQTTTIDEINRERRNTHFSERAEKRAIEKDVLKEVSIEIEENVKRALEEMRDAEDTKGKTTTTTRDEENIGTTKTKNKKQKNKQKSDALNVSEDKDKKTKKKKRKTKKKSKSKSTENTCSTAKEQQQKAMYDSIDAYPIVKYLLEHNVKIDSLCTKCSSHRKKFIASSADEFVYGLPEDESSLAVKPDRSIDDQKRVIESIKSNVLLPLGASTSDAWLESYEWQKKPPKHLLLIGPRGCGQKHFAKHVLARESGSVFFDASIENVKRRTVVRKDDDDDDDELNANKTTTARRREKEKEEERAFCANVLKRTFQLAKKWAPSVVYVGNVENVFATGKEKKRSKKTSKSNDKRKSKEEEEEEEEEEGDEVDGDGTNTNEVTDSDDTYGRGGVRVAAAGCETNADAAVTQREEEQNIDPKSFKLALTAALKALEKENGATINATRRVCVVASISDVSRLTKKDEKILLGKIFHSKAAFAAPFMRPSRAARYDLLKTFYREEVDKHMIECTKNAALSSPSTPSTTNNNLVRCVADGARDEGALSELSHFAQTCNRKVLTLCVREGFRNAILSSSSWTSSVQRRTTTTTTTTTTGGGLSRVVVHPHLFTDAQRALVWRFASAALRRLRSEEEEKRKKKTSTKSKVDAMTEDEYAQNAFVQSSFFVFPDDDDDDEKESSIRAFAKRVVVASSKSTKF